METAVDAALPNGTQVLWGDSSASLSGTALTLTASATEGSSLVAIKKGDTILWSFLVWVTASEPASIDLPSGAKLQELLGGQLYFQWGRKDPLLSGATRLGNENHGLENSIQNPSHFIKGVESAWDWFCEGDRGDQDATLWGGDSGRKTVWDPCPQGYRVPSEADYTSIIFEDITKEKGFLQLGFYGRDIIHTALSSSASYWTRTVSEFDSSALDGDEYVHSSSVFYGFKRDYALPIRCVKE